MNKKRRGRKECGANGLPKMSFAMWNNRLPSVGRPEQEEVEGGEENRRRQGVSSQQTHSLHQGAGVTKEERRENLPEDLVSDVNERGRKHEASFPVSYESLEEHRRVGRGNV